MTSGTNDIERRALALVEDALERPSEERRDFILAASEHDPALRGRALSILGEDGGERPALATGGGLDHAPGALAPETIGAYRIEREIGRGGMGAVYFGRRMAEDFDLTAAIKVVRADFASPRLVERLRAERRTLARLRHPNIAQMYDGGETAEGAPYLVMEYVEGAPLDEYLAMNEVSLRGRLRLFLDACAAVSFAHRNLVIHRDLTPANMLVSQSGQVKLIDFGIAHSLGEEAPANAPKTTMTKGYAAPERVGDEAASTITDVYSLGVILEEMTAGMDAPRREDLTAIAAKASAVEPEARYQTVDALIADLEAYERGAAVLAVEGGWRYRLARFAGRWRVAVGAGAFAFAAALGAGAVMSVLYLRADAAERRATERFDEVRELANFIMFDFHDEVARLDGSTPAREMLADTALDYLDALSAAPDASHDLKLEVALGYKRLGDVMGNSDYADLGRREDAGALVDKAARQIDALKENRPDDPAVLSAFVAIRLAEGRYQALSNQDFQYALTLFDEARAVLGALAAPTLADRLNDARLDLLYGYALRMVDLYTQAPLDHIRSAIEKYEALTAAYPDNDDARLELARSNVTLAEAIVWRIYYTTGDRTQYVDGLPFFEKGIAQTRALMAAPDATYAVRAHLVVALLKRANTTCYMDGREEQGLADLNEAETVGERLLAGDPDNDYVFEHITHITIQKTECFYNLERFDEAAASAEKAVARREAQVERSPGNPSLLNDLANVLTVAASLDRALDDWPAACGKARRMQAVWRAYDDVVSASAQTDEHEREGNRELYAECAERGL